MPRTKKAAAEEAVAKTVEEVAVAAPAEETAAPAPEKEEKPAKTRKPRTAKKAAEKAPAEKKTAEKKTAKKAAEKPARAAKKTVKLTAKVVVEINEKSATPDELVERAKTDWANKGNSVDDIKELAVYVNAAEGTVYYVVNDDYLSGSFDF